jgi:hypothetical protein
MDLNNLATSMVAFTVLGLSGASASTKVDEQTMPENIAEPTISILEMNLTGISEIDILIADYEGRLELERQQQETLRVQEWAEADVFAEKQMELDGVIAELFTYVGKTPYGFGSTPKAWDCSGLTKWFLSQRGIEVVHSATAQIIGKAFRYAPLPGDLVGFTKYGSSEYFHVGVYIGGGMMIHSANTNSGTVFQSVSQFADSENSLAVFVRY